MYKLFYEDSVGLTSICIPKNTEKEAKKVFDIYYGKCFKFISIVRQK